MTEAEALEEVLQEHLFENVWLLDPGWERATGDVHMEPRVVVRRRTATVPDKLPF